MDLNETRRRIRQVVESTTGLQIRRLQSFAEDEDPAAYAHAGHIPFGKGYTAYKLSVVNETLSSSTMMALFRNNRSLPGKFGYALDERCIEYPWVLARIEHVDATVLDAGSTLNYSFVVEHLKTLRLKVYILTLAPEDNCFWREGWSYVYEDVCHTPFHDSYFDYIVCISTLEHVGLDNRMFAGDFRTPPLAPDAYLAAMREMHRTLKPGGKLFLSVPFGSHLDMGTAQVFDSEHLNRAVHAFGGHELERCFYRYTKNGWQISNEVACRDARFVPWIATPSALRSATFPLDTDHAAAARAVALLTLEK